MDTNVGNADRILRVLIGVSLILFAAFATTIPYSWIGWIGVIPLFTALVGWCPIYRMIGANTCLKGNEP